MQDRGQSAAARLLAGVAVLFMVGYPLGVVIDFVVPGQLANELHFAIHDLCDLDRSGVALPYRLGAMMLALFGATFVEWALFATWQVLRRFARGETDTPAVFLHMKCIGVALFASVVVDIALRTPISMILSWPLGKGQRYAAFGVGSDDALMLFGACAVFVVARVLAARADAGRS